MAKAKYIQPKNDANQPQTVEQTNQDVNQLAATYDELFKSQFEFMPDEQIVRFINATYNVNLPLDSKVERLATESNANGKRLKDLIFGVQNNSYHMEVQTSGDGSMTLRMVEYGIRSAILHGKEERNNVTRLTFPKAIVFYLRGGRTTPTEDFFEAVFPDYGNLMLSLPMRTMRIKDYTFEQLAEKSLIPLLEFYPMKYLTTLGSKKERDTFLSDIKKVPKILENLFKTGRIDENQRNDILSNFQDIALQTIHRTTIRTLKGDLQVMEAIRNMDTILVRDIRGALERQGAESKKEGKKEGKMESIATQLRKGVAVDLAQEIAMDMGVTKAEFDKICAMVAKEQGAGTPALTT